MDISILKLASKRQIGNREWENLKLNMDTGSVRYGSRLLYPRPKKPEFFFMWKFHEHRGGAGGLEVFQYKDQIKEMVVNLMKHQNNA